jgi:hypothetical protein
MAAASSLDLGFFHRVRLHERIEVALAVAARRRKRSVAAER